MKGQITLTVNNHNVGSIDADKCPELFLELVSLARSEAPKAREAAATKAPGAPKTSSTFDTRTKAGRDALDATVMDALGAAGDWVRVSALSIPVDPAQLRSSLHRLVGAKVVKRRGKARATEYLNMAEKGSAAKADEAAESVKAPTKAKKKVAKKKAPPRPAKKKAAKKKKGGK